LIAICTAATLGLLVLDQFVLTPYLQLRESVETQRDKVMQAVSDANSVFDRQRRLRKVWTEMQQGGLKTDASQAESQALHAILDWAQSAGVTIASFKSERPVKNHDFQIIGFHVTGTGSMSAISRMLWGMESAKIPVRLNDMQITPRKEATDDLTIQLSVSTLCTLADADKSARPLAAASREAK
jgi:hypothetical protein